jgi:nucleoside-diphosphate-sugar epimerase
MRILVTGGGGFLGRNLVRLLALDAGNEIVVVSRSPVQQVARDYAGNTPNVRYVDGVDIESQSCISGHVNGVETVYHLAARIEFDTRSYHVELKKR